MRLARTIVEGWIVKIRKGFVSNSSTSSFVVIGIDVTEVDSFATKDWEEWEDWEGLTKWKYQVLRGSECGVTEGRTIIGIGVCKAEDCGLTDSITSLADITRMAEELREALGVSGEAKLYCGTRLT